MKRLPSREEILTLLDRLEQEPADALESDVLARLEEPVIWTAQNMRVLWPKNWA